MATHYNEPIIDYWFDEIKQGIKRAQDLPIIYGLDLFFTILFNVWLYFFDDRDINSLTLFEHILILYSFLTPIFIIFYIIIQHFKITYEFRLHKFLKRLNKNRFRLVDLTKHEKFKNFHEKWRLKFNIPDSKIVLWKEINNDTSNIVCCYYKEKYQLIIPTGFFGLIKKDIVSATIIYTHELSHIRQRDPNNLIFYKFIVRARIYFLILPSILFFIGDIFKILHANVPVNIDPLISAFPSLFWLIFWTQRAHRRGFNAERNADMASALLFGIQNLEHTLKEYSYEMTFFKKIMIKAPSLKWRLEELNVLKKYFPELTLNKNESQSLMPNLEELK